jgi:hypothetical protein
MSKFGDFLRGRGLNDATPPVRVNTEFEIAIARLDTGEFQGIWVDLQELITVLYRLADQVEGQGGSPIGVTTLRSFAASLIDSYAQHMREANNDPA